MSYDPEVISLSGSSGDDVLHGISAKLLQQAHKRIALIGCFRPRQCGIATFTADVYDHLTATGPGIDVDVYAMRSALAQGIDTAITHSIDDDSPVSYRAEALAINRSDVDALGGASGRDRGGQYA